MAYNIDIPSSKNKLRMMRKYVTEILTDHQVSEIETNMIVLAVDEVCANIIIHGHQGKNKQKVSLSIDFSKQGVSFEIIDYGHAFDIVSYEAPAMDDLIKNQKKGGIGIMLVKKIMDEIQFSSNTQHNTLKLFKKVSFKS
jgi:serine/threonine-protein kinase RsbW